MSESKPRVTGKRLSLPARAMRVWATLLLLVGVAMAVPACETYDAPPQVFVLDLVDGNLPDNKAPIVLQFSEPVVAATLSLKLVLLETDDEGNLYDEDTGKDDDGKATELTTFFVHDPTKKKDEGGKGVLSKDRLTYTITLDEPLPIGPSLALLVEPGLADDAGTVWDVRQRITFGYRFDCAATGVSQIFKPGSYFFVVNVESPIPTQLQLWVWFDIDPETGVLTGQFTNADRKPGESCGCAAKDGCSSFGDQCVAPSFKAPSEDAYIDFIPNAEPPQGYTFRANACAADQADGTVSFANAPVDVAITQPPVTVEGTRLTAQFVLGADGVLRCSGSFTGERVILGTAPSGVASGTFVGRHVEEDEAPTDVPHP